MTRIFQCFVVIFSYVMGIRTWGNLIILLYAINTTEKQTRYIIVRTTMYKLTSLYVTLEIEDMWYRRKAITNLIPCM